MSNIKHVTYCILLHVLNLTRRPRPEKITEVYRYGFALMCNESKAQVCTPMARGLKRSLNERQMRS
ncbi:hypothetical protein HKBW3S34_00726 [Candidatus Hakubella thermalkaliphila]|uniref:Uncharacterized protein n=1 Tax=Candidatus Hakubella thermalkaliphila TaxID=2754717 RepID=A0A6V8PAV5_9ACTN|nr:hypothetical protein HKBW3S34_00726 [Candidatus Hakubella thermalkaliphila]